MNDERAILDSPRRDAFAALDAPVERSWRIGIGEVWDAVAAWRPSLDWAWRPALILVAGAVVAFSFLDVAAVQAYEASKVSTTTFKINQLGQQVLAETMLAGSKIPNTLKDVPGIKEDQLLDAWGREFQFTVPGPGDSPFEIVSYGRDGKLGGTGRDADRRYSEL